MDFLFEWNISFEWNGVPVWLQWLKGSVLSDTNCTCTCMSESDILLLQEYGRSGPAMFNLFALRVIEMQAPSQVWCDLHVILWHHIFLVKNTEILSLRYDFLVKFLPLGVSSSVLGWFSQELFKTSCSQSFTTKMGQVDATVYTVIEFITHALTWPGMYTKQA